MNAGSTSTWSSVGHAKAAGVGLKIAIPSSWKSVEGNRPHIIQKFLSGSEPGFAIVALQIRSLGPEYDRPLTSSEKAEIVAREVAESFVPAGCQLESYQTSKLDGEPCAMFEYEQTSERLGLKIAQRTLNVIVPVKGGIFCIACSTGNRAEGGNEVIRRRFAEWKPVFLLVLNSCVLLDKW